VHKTPVRAAYPWSAATNVMDHDTAYQHAKRMRKQLPEAKNPHRWATFTMLMEALDTLYYEKGVQAFPGDKVLSLLNKCAQKCEWYMTGPATAKARESVPVGIAPDGTTLLRCGNCGEVHPEGMFMRLFTVAELRAIYRKHRDYKQVPTKPQMRKTKFCVNCRYKVTRMETRVRQRNERRAEHQIFTDNLGSNSTASMAETARLAKPVYKNEIDYQRKLVRNALYYTKPDATDARAAFYTRKMALLAVAERRLDEMDEGEAYRELVMPLKPVDTTGARREPPDRLRWTLLLDTDEYQELQALHIAAMHRQPVPDKPEDDVFIPGRGVFLASAGRGRPLRLD